MTIENGRKQIVRGRRKDRSDWAVLLVDHHKGYLSWADFERNQRLIADNANGKGMMVQMDLLALHRVCSRLVGQRHDQSNPRLPNRARHHCAAGRSTLAQSAT